jgi:NIMA (never in mitosis gene a)-related kinase
MLYFDDIKVKEQWIGQQQTMALFERIRPVGKGAYGTAVLYRKKDDDSLVVLKEINIMELSKAERGQAMNEVEKTSISVMALLILINELHGPTLVVHLSLFLSLQVQILSRLDHPNIISYYDNFEQEGVLMIEMEYADGG